jgi:hypothetical protein
MELLINVQDQKAYLFLELLEKLSFIKIESPFSAGKEQVLEGLKEAVEQVKAHKQGKIQLKQARQLLDEL